MNQQQAVEWLKPLPSLVPKSEYRLTGHELLFKVTAKLAHGQQDSLMLEAQKLLDLLTLADQSITLQASISLPLI